MRRTVPAEIHDTDDPKLIVNAVEELLRYLSSTGGRWRVPTEDIEVAPRSAMPLTALDHAELLRRLRALRALRRDPATAPCSAQPNRPQ
ncbi:hypothetical protein ACFC09_39715 [Streptomyces sp. NPDC056161]|uniref:hypothetical protein n=1 Tax=Streptomyces sp. NPDC056161 TaxID=3345732 RepID=UPI0035D66AED